MQLELTVSQPYLPVTQEAEVIFLLRLLPDPRKQTAEYPLDVRMVLDRSGSMDEEAHGGIRKIDALKKAVSQSLGLLRIGKDRLCIVIFDDGMEVILDPTVISDVKALSRLIDQIATGGSTHLSSPLRYALEVSPMPDALPKTIIFTDGIVNSPSERAEEKDCCDLARQANKAGVPLSLFGTGTSYNEAFLKKMAELAGRGSYYEHVRQVGAVRLRLEEDLDALKGIQDRDVKVSIVAENAVEILEAVKYVPQQADLADAGSTVEDEFLGLDVRGQSYLVKAKVNAGNAVGDFKIAKIHVAWQGLKGPEGNDMEVVVNFTADESLISPVDKTVRNTVLNTAGVKATLRGQYGSAKTLFETAGNETMAEEVGKLDKKDEDAKRTLRTKTVTQAHKGTIVGETKKGGE